MFSISVIGNRKGKRYNDRLIYTQLDSGWNAFGDKLWEQDLGFDGAADDLTYAYRYVPNTSAYIVNRVAIKSTLKGRNISTDNNPNRIHSEFFGYDGGGWGSAPVRGNPTRHMIWTGDPTSNTGRTVEERTYDAFGNVLTVKNARGYVTTNTYTGPSSMFLATETNAEGHRATQTWNNNCQRPLKITDLNVVVSDYTYDVHCRETLERVSWGAGATERNDKSTYYVSIGNGAAQYVEVRKTSSNTASGQSLGYFRKYFDGHGNVYKESTPGATSAIDTSTVMLRSFDPRGRIAWESIPLSWAASTSNTASAAQRTTHIYDVLGRPVLSTFADNSRREVTYGNDTRSVAGLSTFYPYTHVRGPECFDAAAANTVCDEIRSYTDAGDDKVLTIMFDTARTDVDAGTTTDRLTTYTYDHLDQLIKVVDPAGIEFSYTYDTFGNRLTASDPGLGLWTYEYNADRTLSKRTDAKGQQTQYWYDTIARETRRQHQLRDDAGTLLSTEDVYTDWDGDGITPRTGAFYRGQVSRLRDSGHTVENHYDKRGLLTYQTSAFDGKTYTWQAEYTPTGQLRRQTYHHTPGAVNATWTPVVEYDTADRQVRFGTYITSTIYNLWGKIVERRYGNGSSSQYTYSVTRGWVDRIYHKDVNGGNMAFALYTKSVAGRVTAVNSHSHEGDLNYLFDYAGRLRSSTYNGTVAGIAAVANQTFTYDRAGRMRSNSKVGTYNYSGVLKVQSNGNSPHSHSPANVTMIDGTTQTFWHDHNGNMTRGLHDRRIAYDGENRPISVICKGNRTEYRYGGTGERLTRIEKAGTTNARTLAYVNSTQIDNFGGGAANEKLRSYLAEEVRIAYQAGSAVRMDYLHHDQLGSLIAISKPDGTLGMRKAYRAFGQTVQEQVLDAVLADEDRDFIGEQYDEDAGLVYLNARYYDPELGQFLQADWFEITEQGVGTNRYSYAFNDPVNKLDPNGNLAFIPILLAAATVANIASTVYTLVTLPATVAGLIAEIQAGRGAAIIGQFLVDYAVNTAIDRIVPFARWVVPNSVRRQLSGLVTRRLDLEAIGQTAIDTVCGVSSFEGSTQVVTKEGRKRIDSLLLNTEVLSRDEVTGELAWKKVEGQRLAEYSERFEITVRDCESGTDQVLKASYSHPFFARMPENTVMAVGAEGQVYRGSIE